MRGLGLGLLLAGLATALADDGWTQYRGPNGSGISTATNLPTTFSETENVRWKTEIKGKAWSSPVILDGQVWVTNAPPDGKQLSAVCLDQETGKVLHEVVVFEYEKPAFSHDYNSHASPTPAIEPGRVYVHFGSSGTACLDTQTGKILWKRNDLPCDHFRGPGSSPVLFRGRLFIPFDGFDYQYVAALDAATGKTVWKTDRKIEYGTDNGDNKKAYNTPLVIEVDGVPQLVSSSAGASISYNPLTGEEIWRVKHGGMNTSTPPLFGNGFVYVTTGDGGDKFLAVKPDGTGDVTGTHVAWKSSQGIPTRPAPILLGDRIYLLTNDGIFSCMDALTGKSLWKGRIEGKYSASPIYADGCFWCFNEEGKSFVVKGGEEFEEVASNQLAAGCMASPAAVGQALYVRTKTHLYRIEKPAK